MTVRTNDLNLTEKEFEAELDRLLDRLRYSILNTLEGQEVPTPRFHGSLQWTDIKKFKRVSNALHNLEALPRNYRMAKHLLNKAKGRRSIEGKDNE